MKNIKLLAARVRAVVRPDRDIISMLWQQETVSIAGITARGKTKSFSFADAVDIAGKSEDEARILVRERLKVHLSKRYQAALIVPSNLVISKNIEVPSTDSREIREIVSLQASRHTPFSKEEIIVSHINIGSFKKNYSKILLLIVPAAGVKKLYVQAEKSGLRIDRVLFAPEGIAGIAARLTGGSAGRPAALVTLEGETSDFTVIINSLPAFVRSLPVGRRTITQEPAKGMARLAEEVKKSLEAYQTENIGPQPPILHIAGFSDTQAESLEKCGAGVIGLPVRKLLLQDMTGPLPVDPECVPGAGLCAVALRFAECRVDLVPEEIRLKQKLNERARDLFVTGILSMCLLVMLMGMLVAGIYMKELYLTRLERTYQGIAGEARELEKELKKNTLVRSYKRARGYSLRILKALYDLLPMDIELNSVSYKKDGKLAVKGTAESMSTVFSFVDSLVKSGYFKEVKTRHTTKRQEGSRDLTDFEINAVVKRPEKK